MSRNINYSHESIPPIKIQIGKRAWDDTERTETFAKYLDNLFIIYPVEPSDDVETKIETIQIFKIKELQDVIKRDPNPTKAPAYDKVPTELPIEELSIITIIFNVILILRGR